MYKKTVLAAFIASTMILSAGCANKAQTGTLFGAGVAGTACHFLAKSTGSTARALITAGCAVAGGYLGNKIGSMLDEKDQLALAEKKKAMIANSAPGTKTQWKSEHTDAVATMETTKQYQKAAPVSIKRVATVQPAPSDLVLLQKPYITTTSSNVRSAPSASAEKVGGMGKGTEFNAIGKTGDWILIGRKGVSVGYIHSTLAVAKVSDSGITSKVKQTANLETINVATPETKNFAVTKVEVAKVEPAAAPKAVEVVKAPSIKGEKPESEISELVTSDEVVASTTCKEIKTSVSADGKTESSSDTYCQSLDDAYAGMTF